MFTGIVETLGEVIGLTKNLENLDIEVRSILTPELKIDQSLSHNGVCLTVTDIYEDHYKVTAIKETLELSNLSDCKLGDQVNLERCVKLSDRLDGHIVQGHVDTKARCITKSNQKGSWLFTFKYPTEYSSHIISKGSICINGVSLTVVQPQDDLFSVAIIPYTYDHTNFNVLEEGDSVNLEFDLIGKYIQRHISLLDVRLNK